MTATAHVVEAKPTLEGSPFRRFFVQSADDHPDDHDPQASGTVTACAESLTWPVSVFLSTGLVCFAAIVVVLIVLSARPR